MKLSVFIALAFTGFRLQVSAQGWFSANNNYFLPGTTTKPYILDQLGNPASTNVGRVEIRDAVTGNVLKDNITPVKLVFDGIFYAGTMQVPGHPVGTSADLVVLAWDVTTGATWEEATIRSAWSDGQITIRNLSFGDQPPATFRDDSNFIGLQFGVVPEPSSYALAATGLVVLFLMVRRGR
jgi:hypothetical protein